MYIIIETIYIHIYILSQKSKLKIVRFPGVPIRSGVLDSLKVKIRKSVFVPCIISNQVLCNINISTDK